MRLEMSDTVVYEPDKRARLGLIGLLGRAGSTAAVFCTYDGLAQGILGGSVGFDPKQLQGHLVHKTPPLP